jgi:glutathione peroxidase
VSRRQELLAAAAELFAARGFHGVSMADVGAACGISGPALYRHFSSKDALLAEMLVSVSRQLLSEGRRRARAAPDATGTIHALVGWHTEFALHNKPLIVLQDRDWSLLSPQAREEVRSLQREYVEVWVDALLGVHERLTRPTARAMAHAVFGLLNSTPRSSHLPEAEMAPLLHRMAVAALGMSSRVGSLTGMSLLDQSIARLDGTPATLGDLTGRRPALIVNVASKCGLTPQYEALEALHEKYADRGFTVVGVPCNQFMGQEPGSPEEIAEFCSSTYGVTFPLTEKVDVNGEGRHPVYAELVRVPVEGGDAGDISWNFEKFLIDGEGRPLARFGPRTVPDDPQLVEAIEHALG